MSVFTIGSVVVGAAATGYGIYSSNKASKEAAAAQAAGAQGNLQASLAYTEFLRQNAAAFEEKSAELLAQGRQDVDLAYSNIHRWIGKLPTLESLNSRAEDISRKDFDFRTGIKRENLSFILGDTQDELRTSQRVNADLAAMDGSDFTGNVAKILRSNILGLKAATVGEPIGSFANLSASNLAQLSQQGLSNTIAISDFFSRAGTVDPMSPYQISSDLYRLEENKIDKRIAAEQYRGNSMLSLMSSGLGVQQNILGANNNVASAQFQGVQAFNNTMAGLGGAESYANAQSANSIVSALGGMYGMYQQNQALGIQRTAAEASAANSNAMTKYYLEAANRYKTSTPTNTATA